MIVSDSLGYADVFGALEPPAITLGRPVNPTVYERAQLANRTRQDNAFVQRVLAQSKIWLIGQSRACMPSPLENLSGPGKPLRPESPDDNEKRKDFSARALHACTKKPKKDNSLPEARLTFAATRPTR